MAEIINLNKARKRKERAAAATLAAENRVRFGRSKLQREQDEAAKNEAALKLDQLHRETDSSDDQPA